MKHLTDKNIEWEKWITGAAAGALLMYIFDPDRGAPRRAYTAEKMRGLTKDSGDALERVVRKIGEGDAYSTARDYASELTQHAADAGSQFASRASDALHSAESRTRGAFDRASETGEDMAAKAADALHSAEARLRSTMNRATESASDALAPLLEATRGSWTPAARSAAVVGGGVFGLYALARRSPLAIVAGLVGLALLTRGASNRPLRSLVATRGDQLDEDLTRTKALVERGAMPSDAARQETPQGRFLH